MLANGFRDRADAPSALFGGGVLTARGFRVGSQLLPDDGRKSFGACAVETRAGGASPAFVVSGILSALFAGKIEGPE